MFPTTADAEDELLRAPSPSLWDGPTALRPRLPSTEAEVVVVGAGITGLSTALLLARAGCKVVVLEAAHVGALASGRNTGKVSLLQGTKLSGLLAHHPERVVRAYVEGNREGAAWLRRFCEHQGVRYQPRAAITYAPSGEEVPTLAEEMAAAHRCGLPVRWHSGLDVPFDVHAALSLDDQFQVDPRALVLALADELEHHGGTIGEDQRVVDVSWGRRPTLRTEDGAHFRCRHLVLATGTPILDRGLYFAKLIARRSYLLAFTGVPEMPPGMMISAGPKVHSLRDVPGTEPTLLVGGGGHVVGRGDPELTHVEELRAFVAEVYPEAVETHAWSAQDYTSHDGIPYVGRMPRGQHSIWLASGYDKWGLANAASSALRITGTILGSAPAWARPLERRITRPANAAELVRRNVEVAAVAANRLARAEVQQVSRPPEHTGEVGRRGADPRPIGVVSADCAVRAICTHLGGTLRWNDAEGSWDCPLHGSRFSPDGAVLEGPAVRSLPRVGE